MPETAAAPSSVSALLRLAVIAAFAGFVALAGLRSLPPLDRDEARFAQASAQMLETGDFITIRFQEDERNKKPAGIYWLQAASVSAFSSVEAREIWAYRLPSVAGAVLAALFTYMAGARLYGPATGFLAALLLAASPALAAEATIAKTDAVLLATVCAAQAAFIHVFARWKEGARPGWLWPLTFWVAIGAGILVKGPIAPMVVGLTGALMFLRAPNAAWIRALRPLTGLAVLILMIAPWAVAINIATDGRFFAEAIGADMAAKLGEAQESHSGPPGYYLALVWVLFWPAAGLLIPGLIRTFVSRTLWPSWFLISWLVPSWAIFELTATKLPHYTLPLYPALAILAARAAASGAARRRRFGRCFAAIIYAGVGGVIAALVAALPHIFGAGALTLLCYTAAALIAAGSLLIAALFMRGEAYFGALAAAGMGGLVAWTVLSGVLPSLDRLMVSPRLSAALDAAGYHELRDGAPPAALAGYSEPSAVFLLGTRTVLTDARGAARHLAEAPGSAAIIEAGLQTEFDAARAALGLDTEVLAVVDGFNYSKGRNISLSIIAARTSH